jgi:hypothetical protein
MRAVQVTRFGAPEVLRTSEVPDPVAGAAQVVVEVSVAPVLFLDTQIRRGLARDGSRSSRRMFRPPGWPGGQRRAGGGSRLGRPNVVTDTGQSGGYAERALAAAGGLVEVPDGLSLREAAALLHDGRTALGIAEGSPGAGRRRARGDRGPHGDRQDAAARLSRGRGAWHARQGSPVGAEARAYAAAAAAPDGGAAGSAVIGPGRGWPRMRRAVARQAVEQ